jgi:hypothetical protein
MTFFERLSLLLSTPVGAKNLFDIIKEKVVKNIPPGRPVNGIADGHNPMAGQTQLRL